MWWSRCAKFRRARVADSPSRATRNPARSRSSSGLRSIRGAQPSTPAAKSSTTASSPRRSSAARIEGHDAASCRVSNSGQRHGAIRVHSERCRLEATAGQITLPAKHFGDSAGRVEQLETHLRARRRRLSFDTLKRLV